MGSCEGAKRSAGAKYESHAKPSICDVGVLSAAARSPSETKRSGAISKEFQWFKRAEEAFSAPANRGFRGRQAFGLRQALVAREALDLRFRLSKRCSALP